MINLFNRTSVVLGIVLMGIPALAEEAAAASGSGGGGWVGVAAAIALAIAALGGALGQAKIGAAAMDGIARNPQAQEKMFIPMIIGLALIESLVIYALAFAFVALFA